MLHFFAADLDGLFLALLLGIPTVVLPGHALGWWLNIFHFRTLPPGERLYFSLTFGMTMLPALLYLSLRLGSAELMWLTVGVLAAAGLLSVCIGSWSLPEGASQSLPFGLAAAVWLALSAVLLLDLHTEYRLYPSSAIIDSNVRSQIVASLSRVHDLPPVSYFSNADRLHYHYALFLIGGLIEKLGRGMVSARMALVALTCLSGIVLITAVALFVRWALPASGRRGVLIAWFLLLIGGLDIIPFSAEMIRRAFQGSSPVLPFPDIEWWNQRGQVFSWVDTALWHPHHIVGLVACLIGSLLVFHSLNLQGARRWAHVLAAGLSFASGAYISVLVAVVFAVFLLIVLIELLLHSPARALPLLASSLLACFLFVPFYMEIRDSGAQVGASNFQIGIRPFQPATLILLNSGLKSGWVWNATYLALLPLNYLLELGVFLIAGLWWTRERFRYGYQERAREHLLIGLTLVSLLMVTFFQAGTLAANDFGYRAILPAQFVLLLCATELFDRYWNRPSPSGGTRRLVQVAFIATGVGLATTALGAFVMRHSIGFGDPGIAMYHVSLRRDHSAERLFDLRSAYLWIRSNTPESAVIQEDPVTWQTLSAQYGERRTSIYSWFKDNTILGTKGTDSEDFDSVRQLFEANASPTELRGVCSQRKIDYVVIQDSDPVWFDHASYVWTEEPTFASKHVRVFRCD